MSIPVKIGGQEVMVFDITTDDIKITSLGNVSTDTPQQLTPSLCATGECYQCGTSQCTEVKCNQTKCTEKKCNQVKCHQVECTERRCQKDADSMCSACSTDN